MRVTPTSTGCLGGEIKEPKESILQVFEYNNNDRELESIFSEIQKIVL